ncbi:MAG: chorismate mutase [Micavibrio aeruginosavorus]|uniref:chorismate mutase n=1 Tax=Micavibrio aeruginosavorus TaxID=349221 RepID=A0A2W5Q443_9BACT|nr:MAG: chorismate mutase [Micavibrio aeruginosavorus]
MPDKKSGSGKAKPYNSVALDEIRQKIDELDNRIHDTLMERAELVLKVGEEKRKNNIQIVQPAREARMIRRLLGRHKGALPEMAVVRIWRELVGAVSLLQKGLKVTVAMQDTQNEYWDLARDYFGSCLPMTKAVSAISAISTLKDGKTTFAVVPCPIMEDDQPWWTFLDQNAPDPMKIIMRLPHGEDPANPNPDYRALVVSKAGFDDSGQDNSFLLIQCDASISRARLVEMAKKAGLTALGLSSKRNSSSAMPSVHLMEVEDYVTTDDTRLSEFIKALEDPGANVVCVGGYPVPPLYSRTVKSPDADENILKASA